MKLIYYPAACSLADHIALIEADLAYDLVSIDHGKKTADGRDFLAINPKGYVPALELDDGTVLTENQVILRYIAEASGRLLPEGIGRWRVFETLAFMSSEIHPAYLPFFRDFPEVEKERAREKLARCFDVLEAELGDAPFLAGEAMSIADCYLFWVLMVAPRSGVVLPARLDRHFGRLRQRPSIVRAFAEEGLAA